jgi:two-component system, OmpR family, response regulator
MMSDPSQGADNHVFPELAPSPRTSHAERSQPARILLAEDDPAMRGMLTSYLEDNNMRVLTPQRRCLEKELSRRMADLMILGLDLREVDGFDRLRKIRSYSDIPLILTSDRCNEIDRTIGLELGADAYMAKPFSLRELLARIRALLRRKAEPIKPPRKREHVCYCFGKWTLDLLTRRVTDRDGKLIAMTKAEYNLLVAFLEAPQRPLTREQLLRATHVNPNIVDRTVDVQVLRLRRKFEDNPGVPRIIRTERNNGYIFTLPVALI